MNRAQIDALRDFAIDHLPRAQIAREMLRQRGEDAFYSHLSFVAHMARGYAGLKAEEMAAATVLVTVCHLRMTQEPPLSKSDRTILHERLAREAQELCMLTGHSIPWLTAPPSTNEEEEEPEEKKNQQQPATTHKRIESIKGRYISTKEAAQWLNLSEQTLREWRSDQRGGIGTGDLNPIKPKGSSKLLWSGDEIVDYIQKQQKSKQ